MSFLEKSGVGLSVPVPVVPIKFLRVPNLLLVYITIYILNSYKDIRKGYCPKNPFWNNWNNWNAFFLSKYPLLLESPKSFFVLSLQLILHDGISCYLSLGSNCLADVHTLIAVNLQGELNGTILGLRHTTVRQLLDQQRLRLELRLRNEFEGAVVQLLCNAETVEARHASHYRLIGSKQKVISIIVISHTALLSVLAGHQLLDFFKILIHNLSEFKSKESEKRSATYLRRFLTHSTRLIIKN